MASPFNRVRVAYPTESEGGQLHLLALPQRMFPTSALTSGTGKLSVVGGCPEHCRTPSSIPNLDRRQGTPPPSGDNRNYSRHHQMSSGEQTHPWLRTANPQLCQDIIAPFSGPILSIKKGKRGSQSVDTVMPLLIKA